MPEKIVRRSMHRFGSDCIDRRAKMIFQPGDATRRCGMYTMCEAPDEVRSLDELRAYIHRTLCAKENLLSDQFQMAEMQLTRRGRECGLQFSLQGPRSVRLGAIWASDHNLIYFYDAKGERFLKVQLKHRLQSDRPAA